MRPLQLHNWSENLMPSRIHLGEINFIALNCVQPLWKKSRYLFHNVYYAVDPIFVKIYVNLTIELLLRNLPCNPQKSPGKNIHSCPILP